ncbi:ABC transporter ATP-binding protein [Ramlibacter sp. MMS24-I3-19]|uniref:ABC transporter ATP-binding protein n=1 Tax=Ramlibacter sp. MMS24-I3-19 TaxID=3416606 RepID=UPI003CFE674C
MADALLHPDDTLAATGAATAARSVIVKLEGIRKSFNVGEPNETEVLHGIDLSLAMGDFCAVMGPSGSGKSTLLNIVGLLDRPTSGRLWIAGQETTSLDESALTRLRGHAIGFVFQYHHLITAFTALENVMLPMLGARGFPSAQITRRAALLLDLVGLTPWRDHPAGRLSGGQQQRVAIARALAMGPNLLLADEPTGNLDTQSADAVFSLLRHACSEQGTTILFVTHNPALAARCDHVVRVVDGRLLA